MGSSHTCLRVISLDSALRKYENYYPQVFLKECKHIEKNVIRHINDNLSDFSSSDECDHSDEELIKDMRLIILRKQFWKWIFWGEAFLKIQFLREQFLQKMSWGIILIFFFFFEGTIFWGKVLKIYFMREQFWKCIFWNRSFWKYFDKYLS